MKIHKKLWLSVLLFLGSVVSLFLLSSPVFAEVSKDTWQKATFQFIDRSTIKATAGGETFDFIDVDPWDNDVEYVLGDGPTGCTNKINGLGAFKVNKLGEFPQTISADKIHLQYDEQATGCSDINVINSIGNASQGARIYFRWIDSERIESIDGKLAFDKDADGSFHVTESKDRCVDRVFVTEQGVKYFELDPDGENIGKFDLVKNLVECKVSGVNFAVYYDGGDRPEGNLERLAGISVSIANPENAKKPPQTRDETDETPGATGSNEACYSKGWELSWIACPVITAAQTAANAMYGFVEDQLKFTVSQSGEEKDSLGDSETRKDVRAAWNNFRILVSGLVVILMLVMVISQAIGSGPFDAYTVRKMLPRLVIGVILIQISWPVFAWVINTVDDLGRGIADLMYAPFGGSEALNLNTIMEPFTKGAMIFSWVGIPALLIFGVVAPFVVLGMILVVLMALLAGFLTLLFRKIIIILALILVPVALISWMMPNDGLRKYWKLWWDNFIKALMMFPLIIAIIAAGRIFAKIGSAQIDFVGFFIVLVGFFGPLFILPKTFKWGGSVMQMAGNAMTKAQTATLKKPKEFLGERQKGWTAERTRQSQERFAQNEGFNWRRPWRRPIDLVKSGRVDPTLWGRRRQQAMDTYVKKGEDSYQEDVTAAETRLVRERQRIRAQGGNHDHMLQAVAEGAEYYDDDTLGRVQLGRRSDIERVAARKQLAKLGAGTNWRYLEHYYEESRRQGGAMAAEARKFFDDNVETIMPRLPHIYKGIGNAADASPDAIAQMHGVEIESILANLTHQINTGTTVHGNPADIAKSQTSLTTFLQNYQRAAENPQTRVQLENGGLRAVKAFLDDDTTGIATRLLETSRDAINTNPRDGRRIPSRNIPTLERSAAVAVDPAHRAALDGLRTSLADQINEDGFYTPP